MRRPIPIVYWSDPLCIWAYLAHDKIERLQARFGDEITFTFRVVPVFGSVPQRFRTGTWAAGGPEQRTRRTAEIAQEHGHTEVDGAVWRDDPPASSWAPAAVIKAADLLADEGVLDSNVPGALAQALRAAFFRDNHNVARREVQRQVVEGMSLPWTDIQALLDDGRALAALWEDHVEREACRVQGSPTWSFDDGRAMLFGNVSERVLQATVAEMLAGAAPGGSDCG